MYRSGHMTRSYVQIRTDDWWPYCTDFVCMCELHWHVCMRAMSACTTGQFIQRAMLISNWIVESNWNPIWNWIGKHFSKWSKDQIIAFVMKYSVGTSTHACMHACKEYAIIISVPGTIPC